MAGRHRTSDPKKDWNTADLDAIVTATLEKSSPRIPFVAQTSDGRHPKNNLPVFGYADRDTLRKTTVDGREVLEIQPVEFADGLLSGLRDTPLNKMSISLTKPNLQLDHICFVERPAVADIPPLTSYEFSASDERSEFITIDSEPAQFADDRMPVVGNVLRSLRDWFIGKFGLEEANRAMPDFGLGELEQYKPEVPDWLIKNIEKRLSAVSGTATQTIDEYSFSEAEMNELEQLRTSFSQMQQQVTEQAVQFSEYRAGVEQREAKLREQIEILTAENKRVARDLQTKEYADFADGLIREGKLLPAERQFVVDDLMLKSQVGKYNFSEGEQDAVQKTMEVLKSRPKLGVLNNDVLKDLPKANFSNYEDREGLAKQANTTAKEKNISFAEALELIMNETALEV